MAQLDLATVLAGLTGLAIGVVLAVLAGRVVARLFFDASQRREDEP